MRVAAILWEISHPGGLNTGNEIFRAVAKKLGDVFHVYLSGKQKKAPVLYPRPVVKGGGTSSGVRYDGFLSHNPRLAKASVNFLRKKGYDLILLVYLAPHPTKSYGRKPIFKYFLDLLKDHFEIRGYIRDGYWDTYAEFGEIAAQYCSKLFVVQEAYAKPLPSHLKKKVKVAPQPFMPLFNGEIEKERVIAWTPQWKKMKGIYPFVRAIPKLRELNWKIEMYNGGIEYFYIRKQDLWEPVTDVITGKEGNSDVVYYGWKNIADIHKILARVMHIVDFQGFKSKYSHYVGSINHTMVESLYYGAVPVVYHAVTKTIPKEFVCPIKNVNNWVDEFKNCKYTDFDVQKARGWVMETHNAERIYWEVTR